MVFHTTNKANVLVPSPVIKTPACPSRYNLLGLTVHSQGSQNKATLVFNFYFTFVICHFRLKGPRHRQPDHNVAQKKQEREVSAFTGVCDNHRTPSLLPDGRAGTSPRPSPRLLPLPGSAPEEPLCSDPLPGSLVMYATRGLGENQGTSENFQN